MVVILIAVSFIAFSGSGQKSLAAGLGILAFLGWLFGVVLTYPGLFNAKNVVFNGVLLEISDSTETVEVPLEEIDSVSGGRVGLSSVIWIHLKRPTNFGQSIPFVAERLVYPNWSKHPAVKRLEFLGEIHGDL